MPCIFRVKDFLTFTLILALPLFPACDRHPDENKGVSFTQKIMARASRVLPKQTPKMNDLLNGAYVLREKPTGMPDILELTDGIMLKKEEGFGRDCATCRSIYELLKEHIVFVDIDKDGIKEAGVVFFSILSFAATLATTVLSTIFRPSHMPL